MLTFHDMWVNWHYQGYTWKGLWYSFLNLQVLFLQFCLIYAVYVKHAVEEIKMKGDYTYGEIFISFLLCWIILGIVQRMIEKAQIKQHNHEIDVAEKEWL